MVNEMRIMPEVLRAFIQDVFAVLGFDEEGATKSSQVLLAADLRAIDSHGIARLPGYVRLVEAGRLNPNAKFALTSDRLAAANVDAGGGSGLLSAPYAMRIAIKKAKQAGTAFVSVHNSNHFGIAGYHALLAAEAGMIGFASTNASPLVTPYGGRQRMLGTNPICFAFPRRNAPGIVVDLATSAAANGKLEIAEREGKPLPSGWLVDGEGKDVQSPQALKTGGMLLPLGSTTDLGAHKGYALGAAMDLLCGVLSGANWGPFVPPFVAFLQPGKAVGKGIGHMLGAIDPSAFQDIDAYYDSMEDWVACFKTTLVADGFTEVLVPGEPETRAEAERKIHGIALQPATMEELRSIATSYQLKMPF